MNEQITPVNETELETESKTLESSREWSALERYLRDQNLLAPEPTSSARIQVQQFTGGHANLTYLVTLGDHRIVVRRPPHGTIPKGANDMQREFRVLNGLWPVYACAPRPMHYCDRVEIIGAPFVVTEYRQGCVVRDEIPSLMRHHNAVATRVSLALVDAMAALHAVDYQQQQLASLGRPDGFVQRQLRGWKQRWDIASTHSCALFDDVWRALESTQPESSRVSVVHNDFKLDNCQFNPDNPDTVTAVFDWDMATLGDPLIDLGNLLGYWQEAGESVVRLPTRRMQITDLPNRNQLINRYQQQSGITADNIQWYEAFALWRNAVVFRQLASRYERGETPDHTYRDLNDSVLPIVETAAKLVL